MRPDLSLPKYNLSCIWMPVLCRLPRTLKLCGFLWCGKFVAGHQAILSHHKDIFKTSYATLGNAAAPGILYEVGPVPLAKVWAQICLNQS